MAKQLTIETFKARLATFGKSNATIRGTAQEFIEFGLEVYANGGAGDTHYLSAFVKMCIGKRTLNTTQITSYIKGHANVKHVKTTDGTKVFKKLHKGDTPAISIPTVSWFDWEKEPAAPKEYKLVNKLDSIIKATQKAIDDGLVADVEGTEALLSQLVALVQAPEITPALESLAA